MCSTSDFDGTGFELQPSGRHGAGTDWRTIKARVVPGDFVELRFVLFDADEPGVDTVVLLDSFRWSSDFVTSGLQ